MSLTDLRHFVRQKTIDYIKGHWIEFHQYLRQAGVQGISIYRLETDLSGYLPAYRWIEGLEACTESDVEIVETVVRPDPVPDNEIMIRYPHSFLRLQNSPDLSMTVVAKIRDRNQRNNERQTNIVLRLPGCANLLKGYVRRLLEPDPYLIRIADNPCSPECFIETLKEETFLIDSRQESQFLSMRLEMEHPPAVEILPPPRPPLPYIGNIDCAFNARSRHLRCAVNPDGDCDTCTHFEAIAKAEASEDGSTLNIENNFVPVHGEIDAEIHWMSPEEQRLSVLESRITHELRYLQIEAVGWAGSEYQLEYFGSTVSLDPLLIPPIIREHEGSESELWDALCLEREETAGIGGGRLIENQDPH